MPDIFQKEANAYDRMLDAAADLAELIESGGIQIDEFALEELTIFLAKNGPAVRQILKGLKGIPGQGPAAYPKRPAETKTVTNGIS